MYQYAQRPLEVHPTIENLMWFCAYNIVLYQGLLPNLKHLSLSHLSFIRVLSAACSSPSPPSPSPDSASEGTGTYLCTTTTTTEWQADARDAQEPLPLLDNLLTEMQDIDGMSVQRLSIKFCDGLTTRSISIHAT